MSDLASPNGAGVTSSNPLASDNTTTTTTTTTTQGEGGSVAIEMTSVPLGEGAPASPTRKVTIDGTATLYTPHGLATSTEGGLRERGHSEVSMGHSITSLGHSRRNSYWSSFSFEPHHVENAQAVLTWKDLTVRTAKNPNKLLLKNVSGQITGGFWAVMGPSGSGKSTLLLTLACRLTRGMWAEGEFRLNGRPYSQHDLKAMAGYVLQDDLLNANLTVLETLQYSAELRLPRDTSKEHRQERVEESLEEMGLLHCRDVIVGDSLRKGISGGERKRLAVAMELLTHPILLFLDEPTSGLDSVTAASLCEKLKALGATGRTTVVCTIHQPQSKIYKMFDNLLLLKSGEIVYQGKADKALDFFAKAGFPCPDQTNPADHLLDVITPQLGEDLAVAQAKGDTLKKYFRLPEIDLSYGQDKPLKQLRDIIPWHKQFRILLRRSAQEHIRKWDIIVTQCINSALVAILIGFVFYDIGDKQVSINKRQAVLFFTVISQGIFASLQTVNSFPSERALVLRERAAGTYYVSAYFMAKTVCDSFFHLLPPIIFSAIVYRLVGLQHDAGKWFIYLAFMILTQFSATSLATMVSTLCRTTDLSTTILPIGFEIGRLFGGFFLPPSQLPHYFVWLDALSYVKYAYTGISLNELDGLALTCTSKELNSSGNCPVTSGQQTIDRLGLDYISINQAAGFLILYIIVTRIIAFLGLRFIKW